MSIGTQFTTILSIREEKFPSRLRKENRPPGRCIEWPGGGFMSFCARPYGDSYRLLVLAVAAAVWLSQDTDSDTLGKLAAFFTVLGDILALFALQPELLEGAAQGQSPSPEAQLSP